MPIHDVARLLRSADRIAVLSGAGLSKASGIPTYRDAGGLWTQAATAKFSSVEELERDPEGFRSFWRERRREIATAEPNPGHIALAELQHLKPETALITQNVDGLLTKAGAKKVLEIHGSLFRDRCSVCSTIRVLPLGNIVEPVGPCPTCSATKFRPDVVMFGEFIDSRVGAEAEYLSKTSQVFLVVGTSAVVYPAAGMAEKAQARGARLLIVNAESTPLDDEADAVIRGLTEEVLPLLVEQVKAGSRYLSAGPTVEESP